MLGAGRCGVSPRLIHVGTPGMPMHIVEALIYLPHARDAARWARECAEYCQAHAYQVLAVVTRWEDVISLVRDGFNGVIVVPPGGLLPPDRLPRVEVVDEAPPVTPEIPGQRRVRRQT